MFDLVLIIILLLGFIIGLRRGFILQIVHLTGFIVAFIVAYLYYDELTPKLVLWIPYPTFGDAETMQFLFESTNLETAYYRAIAFAIIFFATKFLMQILGSMLDFLANLPILKQINGWAGGLLGFVEVYLLVFIVLYIGALLPVELVQSNLNDSFMAKFIVQHTPFFTGKIKDMWI
ncbi:CvpA family protein [Ferdinandcohnia sp. Marseille-Q9671]